MIGKFFLVSLITLMLTVHAVEDFLDHIGSPGTQHGRDKSDPKFYYTHSEVPSQPFITGFKGTHGTPRFSVVAEQTFLMIGEAKHGLWRTQDNGHIREYRRKGKVGLSDGDNPNAKSLDQNTLNVIRDNYAFHLPEESWDGYKYPDDKISDGSYDGMKNYLNFVDLSIYHPKYGGKYNNHVTIDLPFFYCTMTQNDYPYVANVWKFAVAQPQANKLGPLGLRAGLDIKENYLNVLRLNMFDDANLWVNVGVGDPATDPRVTTINEIKSRAQTVAYKTADLTKHPHEIYLIERLFFNKPYIFVALVMDDNPSGPPGQFPYVRPDGVYWDDLATRQNRSAVLTKHNYFPKVYLKEDGQEHTVHGIPLYGHHSPNRRNFGLNGGACPNRGGDFGRYPWSNSGGSWPTAYQEITPLCDAFALDMKFHANLWVESWETPTLNLGNSAFNTRDMEYTVDANIYGAYDDPYLANEVNPFYLDMTTTGQHVEPNDRKPNPVIMKLNYDRLGEVMGYNPVDISKPAPDCPAVEKCKSTPTPEVEATASPDATQNVPTRVLPEGEVIYLTNSPKGDDDDKDSKSDKTTIISPEPEPSATLNPRVMIHQHDDGDIPDWGIAVIVLLVILILINLMAVISFFCISPVEQGSKEGHRHSGKNEVKRQGVVNEGMA